MVRTSVLLGVGALATIVVTVCLCKLKSSLICNTCNAVRAAAFVIVYVNRAALAAS